MNKREGRLDPPFPLKNCQKLFRTEIKLTRLILCSASHPQKFPGTANLSWFRLHSFSGGEAKMGHIENEILQHVKLSTTTYQNIIMCVVSSSVKQELEFEMFFLEFGVL